MFKRSKLIFFYFAYAVLLFTFHIGQPISLKIAGDEVSGYHVDIYNNSRLLVTNTEEFSLKLFNTDLSTVAEIKEWKGQTWKGTNQQIVLSRQSYIPELDANLTVDITYQVVNNKCRKEDN